MTFSASDSNFYIRRCYYICCVLSDCRERSGWLDALNHRHPGRRQVQQHHALKILIVVTFTARILSHGFSQAFWKGIKHTLVCLHPFSLNASRSLKINIAGRVKRLYLFGLNIFIHNSVKIHTHKKVQHNERI